MGARRYDLRFPVLSASMLRGSGAWRGDPDPANIGMRPIGITPRSPISLRRAVEQLAWCFKREFHYDFVQYEAEENSHPRDVAYLWVTERHYQPIPFGAAVFRWRDYREVPPGMALAWVWFHPYERSQGHLRKAWPYFVRRFGLFYVEGPLSPAMRVFLRKMKHHDQAGPAWTNWMLKTYWFARRIGVVSAGSASVGAKSWTSRMLRSPDGAFHPVQIAEAPVFAADPSYEIRLATGAGLRRQGFEVSSRSLRLEDKERWDTALTSMPGEPASQPAAQ